MMAAVIVAAVLAAGMVSIGAMVIKTGINMTERIM